MFTQCPKCQSVFMVSDKDVKAHEGLVRCGNCYSVFNSSWNLTEDPRVGFAGGNVPNSPNSSAQSAEPVDSASTRPASSGSGFTFSLLGNQAPQSTATQPAEPLSDGFDESPVPSGEAIDVKSTASVDGEAVAIADEVPLNNELEPFPEPDMNDFPAAHVEPEIEKEPESLLYFDTNEEEEDEEPEEDEEDELKQIEDLTLLQTPSFTSDLTEIENKAVDTVSDKAQDSTFTEESMWPGSDDDELDVSDEVIDRAIGASTLTTANSDEAGSIAAFFAEPELEAETPPVVNNTADPALNPDEVLLPPIVDENLEAVTIKSDEEESYVTDDTYSSGASSEADEYFSIDSLPKTADEAFSSDEESDGSVFITSDEEAVDESYVPISLKSGEQDELFHDLDEFPEPGELSALNYEDTMEINAMLEEANISKEQIESAMSASEVTEGGDKDHDVEEISLSSGGDDDFTEALFSDNEEDVPEVKDNRRQGRKEGSRLSFFKNLMPIGFNKKKAWKEPVIADDQTQLIKSLSRARKSDPVPLWVGKYSLIAAIFFLSIALIGQLGYFYMDKMANISALRPVLELGCKIANCRVPTPQNIDRIEQLSSRLDEVGGQEGGFKVSSVLVNRDIRSQVFPALELILTDRSGNMISRRIITRDKYLDDKKKELMLPNEATEVAIRFHTPSIRVDGFELRAVSQNWLERSK